MPPCAASRSKFGGPALDESARERGGISRGARALAARRRTRGARARGRQRRALPRSAAVAAACPSKRCRACAANASRGPIDRVGLYVPAGSAPLPSTAIMLAVPARIAGCASRAIASSPGPDGTRPRGGAGRGASCAASTPSTRWAARRPSPRSPSAPRPCARSTRSSGPAAPGSPRPSRSSPRDPDGAAIDLPAGPSEVLVIADESANARFVAADLLAQAEHDTLAQVMLVTTSQALATRGARRSSTRRPRSLSAPRHRRAVDGALAAASLVADLDDGHRRLQRIRARAPHHPDARAARAAAAGRLRGLGVPRRLVAGVDGRLLLGHQSRAADVRLCAQLQRRVAAGVSEAHHRAGAQRRRAARARPHRRHAVRHGRPRCARQCREGAARRARRGAA